MTGARQDSWSADDFYEPYVGRWSRLVARDFLAWLEVGPQRNWLDVGCGTGALAESILSQARPRRLQCVDLSGAFIAHTKARVGDAGATFAVADAQALPLDAARFDAAVSALVLNFIPRPERGIAEMARTVRSGGIIAAYVWDYAEKMELMRYFWDAAAALDPAAVARRRRALSALPTRRALGFIQHRRAHSRGSALYRRPDPLPRFRRLLASIPRRSGTRARLCHVLE
jgi:SAM-dependent methyltransferase